MEKETNRTVCWHFNGYVPLDSFAPSRGSYRLLGDKVEMFVSVNNSSYLPVSIHPLLLDKTDYSSDSKKENIIGSKFVFHSANGLLLAESCGFKTQAVNCKIGVDLPMGAVFDIPCRLGSDTKCASFSLTYDDDDSDF